MEKTVSNNQESISLLHRATLECSGTELPKASSSSEEWEEGSSSCSSSSCYCGSCSDDSYIANWENYVQSDGSLFYAEYNFHASPKIHSTIGETALNVIRNDFTRMSTRRSGNKGNKSSQLMNKGDYKGGSGQSTRQKTILNSDGANEDSSVEIRDIEVLINPDNRFKFGRRASLTEALLGITTACFPDGVRLKVIGHMVDKAFNLEKHVKVGDWFKSINDAEVNTNNINEILSKYTKPTKAILKFQRILDTELQNSNSAPSQITSFENFVKYANKLLCTSAGSHDQNSKKCQVLNLIILSLDFADADTDTNDVVFTYPNKTESDLYCVRGSLLTLHSILKNEIKTEPASSTLIIKGVEWYITYYSYHKVLILFGIPSKYASIKETRFRMTEFLQYIKFSFDTLGTCLSQSIKQDIYRICDILDIRIKLWKGHTAFEALLQESHLVALPKEAQLRIFDALSEMEAMDFRDWNEEPLNSHREFFIFGSALYFRSYLLGNILPVAQLAGVESFMRCRGIFDFIEKQSIRDLVVWVEIPIPGSSTRYFLAICCRNQLTLAVILQSFETERRISSNGTLEEKIIGPSLFYIEEIQETLDHLRHGGIESLARVWVTSNKRPEVINSVDEVYNRSMKKKTESSSTLKFHSTSSDDIRISSSMGGSSAPSLTHSEDSSHKVDDCDSDSDWDGFPEVF